MKANFRGFNSTLLNLQPHNFNPNINDDIMQSLSRLMVWDYENELWRPVRSDSDGRVYVSTGVTKTKNLTPSQVTVSTSSVLIANENNNRKQILFQNLGTGNMWITPANPAVVDDGIKLLANGTFIDDYYLGAWYAIGDTTNQEMVVMEWA